MSDIVRFPSPSNSGGGGAARAMSYAALRTELEAAARDALDTADRIIAALDRFDSDPAMADRATPAAPVVWLPRPRSDVPVPAEQA